MVYMILLIVNYRMNWIEILGTRYRCGSIVMLSIDFFPVFGFVTDIILLDTFLCEVLTTICFNSHYHSYEIRHDSSPSIYFVKQFNLADHNVLSMYTKNTCHFVPLKYNVIK